MARHLISLTIDTDPDGLAGRTFDRESLSWRSLQEIRPFLDSLRALEGRWGRVPLTWFIRADGQIETMLGSITYLFERFSNLWAEAATQGDEIGWHPHLYRQTGHEGPVTLIDEPAEAADEIRRLWNGLSGSVQTELFRNGEGWHSAATLNVVEELGFRWDSTAIPGRVGEKGHPMNWLGSPNHPYFPHPRDIRVAGAPRPLLEIPMNTWRVKSAYDPQPRLRYINPAIHEPAFSAAVAELSNSSGPLNVWTLILHPDEVFSGAPPDLLYSRSVDSTCRNIDRFAQTLAASGDEVTFVALSRAGEYWTARESAN